VHRIKAIFFDLDGTLIEFPLGIQRLVADIFETACRHGARKEDLRIFERNFWNSTPHVWAAMHAGSISGDEARAERIQRALHSVGIDNPELAEEMRLRWDRINVEQPILKPGALGLLSDTAEWAFLGMITDGYRTIQRAKIERLGLSSYFDAIFVSEEVGASKPSPVIFRRALREAGVQPCEAVMIGDNPNCDIRGALGVGMAAIQITPEDGGSSSPDGALTATSLAAVADLLDMLDARAARL